jgi:hypothetical protein
VVSETAEPVVGGSFVDEPSDRGDGRTWAGVEYLLWWMRGAGLPWLATTGPPQTPLSQAGVPGAPGTAVLFGGDGVNAAMRSGGRLTVGHWLDERQTFGIEANFLLLEDRAAHFSAASDGTGNPILARPFIDGPSGFPAALPIAYPGNLVGSITASETSGGLVGGGVWLRETVAAGGFARLDVLCGYRHLRFTDRLAIYHDVVAIRPTTPGVFLPGVRSQVTDSFDTENTFNGIDLGLDTQFRRGPFTLNVLTKLAVGQNRQDAGVAGSTTTTPPGGSPATRPSGFLALASNIGRYHRNEVSLIPELGVTLSVDLGRRLRASVGYDLLFWYEVVRAGDQVDTTVNPALILGPNPNADPMRPEFRFQRTNLWTQGITFGVEIRF